METNDERRKRKLQELSEIHGLDALAEAAKLKGPESLNQILKGVKLPPKADGSRSERSLGDDTARKIEAALGLERGWFDEDWPFPLVDRALWHQCTAEMRGYVQNAMNQALYEATEGKPLPYLRPFSVQSEATPGQKKAAHSPASPSRLTADEASFVGRISGGSQHDSDTHSRVEGKGHRRGASRPPRKG